MSPQNDPRVFICLRLPGYQSKLSQTLTKSNYGDIIARMDKIISIYEAKTNLSKYIKKAQAGQTIYVGAYGTPQAIIAPIPAKKPINIGVWAHKKKLNAYQTEDLIGPDPDIAADFEDSINRPLEPEA